MTEPLDLDVLLEAMGLLDGSAEQAGAGWTFRRDGEPFQTPDGDRHQRWQASSELGGDYTITFSVRQHL